MQQKLLRNLALVMALVLKASFHSHVA